MYNPAGALLSTSSNGLLRRVLPADGVYTLLVRDRSAINLGSYRVNLQDDTNTCAVNDTEASRDHADRGPPAAKFSPAVPPSAYSGCRTITWAWRLTISRFPSTAARPSPNPFVSVGGNQQAYDWFLPADVAPSRTAVLRITATDAAGNCAIGLQRPADIDRFRLHPEQQRDLHLRRPEPPYAGILKRRQHHPIHVGRRGQPGRRSRLQGSKAYLSGLRTAGS